jgi:hypothetical protein
MRREHTPDIIRQLDCQFPSKQRCRHTGRIKRVHKLSHPEAIAKLLIARRQQHFDLLLSDKIAKSQLSCMLFSASTTQGSYCLGELTTGQLVSY